MIIQDDGIDILYIEDFLKADRALKLFEALKKEVPWESKDVWTPRGKVPMPRLVSWHADSPDMKYKYSGVLHDANPWTPALEELRDSIIWNGPTPNSALCNYYRHSRDSVSPHADDEEEMSSAHAIFSISLGAMRDFVIKHNTNKRRYVIPLAHGSLLTMKGKTQKVSKHSIPKAKLACGERINVTFRYYGMGPF